ncbi:hypothetical protein Ciccas_009573, partial [Cichlidogyrus casuarinus]
LCLCTAIKQIRSLYFTQECSGKVFNLLHLADEANGLVMLAKSIRSPDLSTEPLPKVSDITAPDACAIRLVSSS